MFSATTTELSTSSPTQSIRPSSVSRLSDSPAKYITVSPISRLSGMPRAMIRVRRKRRRNRNSVKPAITPPIRPEPSNVLSASSITSPWLNSVMVSSTWSRGLSASRSATAATLAETSRTLASPSFITSTATAGLLIARTRKSRSGCS